jgi:hypothetical protein
LTKVIVILGRLWPFLKIKIKARQIRQGDTRDIRILFKAMFIAVIILERDDVLLPVDGWIVLLQPVDPENHRVTLDTGDLRG